MNRETCPLHIAPETLSDYRSRVLTAQERAELAAHIPICAACQATLSTFDRTFNELRSQRVPPSGDALWRSVQAGMMPERTRMRFITRPAFLTGVGAATIVAIFAVIFVTLFHARLGQSGTANSPWRAVAALPFAKSVAFATSDPQTGYACGNNGITAHITKPVEVSVTHDGGATWSSLTTAPIQTGNCIVVINPTNPQDVVVLGNDCWVGCGWDTYIPARSLDGGQSWTRLALPDDAGAQVNNTVFVGATVYFAAYDPAWKTPFEKLVKNTTGPSLTLVQLSILQQDQNGNPLGEIWSFGGDLYRDLGCNPVCSYAKTSDGGQTWQSAAMQGLIGGHTIIGQNPGDPSLVAFVGRPELPNSFRSVDGGATWTPIPELPAGVKNVPYDRDDLLQAPDGTLFFGLEVSNDSSASLGDAAVYALTPNAVAWRAVTLAKGPTQLLALAIDTHGHAVKIWALGTPTFVHGAKEPAIITHGV